MAQRGKIARFCDLFKAYAGERAWKSLGVRLKGPCCLSRDGHDRKIRASKQITGIGKYCFANRTIKLWSQLLAEGLATLHSKPNIFRKNVRKVIIIEGREGFLKFGDETSRSGVKWKNGKWSVVKCSEVKWWSWVNCVYYLRTYLLTYLFTYIHTYLLTYLPTYLLLIYLLACLPACSLATPLRFLIFSLRFFLFSVFVFYWVYSVFLCRFVCCFSFCIQLSLSYFCTSIPNTRGLGWRSG